MKTATVYFWGISPFENKHRWHKMATYSKSVALEVIHDKGIFEVLDTLMLCATDDETGEVIGENFMLTI